MQQSAVADISSLKIKPNLAIEGFSSSKQTAHISTLSHPYGFVMSSETNFLH